jgi:hypothetical protein
MFAAAATEAAGTAIQRLVRRRNRCHVPELIFGFSIVVMALARL